MREAVSGLSDLAPLDTNGGQGFRAYRIAELRVRQVIGEAMFGRFVLLLLCCLPLHAAPASADVPQLIGAAFEQCTRGDKSAEPECACHLGVLAEADLSETEWQEIVETMKSGRRLTPRPGLNYGRCFRLPGEQLTDTLSQSISRYARLQCKGAVPKGQPDEWEIQEAANDFILADCRSLAQLLRGNLTPAQFRRAGIACQIHVPSASGFLRYKLQSFKRRDCQARTPEAYNCRGESMFSCNLIGDPIRGMVICQALEAPLISNLELSFEPATCRWRVNTFNGVSRQ